MSVDAVVSRMSVGEMRVFLASVNMALRVPGESLDEMRMRMHDEMERRVISGLSARPPITRSMVAELVDEAEQYGF